MPRMAILVWIICAASTFGFSQDSFVNWEDPHVHALDITPDGNTLLAVNTADQRIEVFDISTGSPVHLQSIAVGIDPVSVRARSDSEAWVVNHISDTVSVVNLISGNVVATLQTEDEPCDVVFAGAPQRAFVSCSQANSVLVFDPDAALCEAIRSVLTEESSCEVATATSALEAGAAAQELKPTVVIADVTQSNLPASAIVRFLRSQESAQVDCLIGTGNDLTESQGQALLQEGFDGFLSKPFDIKSLRNLIEQATSRATPEPSDR